MSPLHDEGFSRGSTEFSDITGRLPTGEYTLFIDLKQPTEWTFIVSSWPAQTKYDPKNKEALYGAFSYTPVRDVVRAPMKVEFLPYRLEQLTWQFVDMTNDSGRYRPAVGSVAGLGRIQGRAELKIATWES